MTETSDEYINRAPARAAIGKVFDAILQMPGIFAVAFVGVACISFIEWWVSFDERAVHSPSSHGNMLTSFGFYAVRSFVWTPMIIAVHRLILLGEISKSYLDNVDNERYWRFFLLSMAYQALLSVGGFFEFLPAPLSFVVLPVALVCMLFVGVRLILVFPAAAVDAPGASLRNAMADSKGSFWLIFRVLFGIMFLLSLPFFGVALLAWLISDRSFIAVIMSPSFAVFSSALGMLSLSACAVAASWLYNRLGNRLKGAAG